MSARVAHRDEPAERAAHHDRLLDVECVAERGDVVAPLLERPLLARPCVAATVATVVVDDDLRPFAQRTHRVGPYGVVEAGTPVEEHERRPLRHGQTVGDPLRPGDVEVELDVIDADPLQPHFACVPTLRSRNGVVESMPASFGRPSTRSPTMLRITSSVPPAMRMPGHAEHELAPRVRAPLARVGGHLRAEHVRDELGESASCCCVRASLAIDISGRAAGPA